MWVVSCVLGFIALSETGDVVDRALYSEVPHVEKSVEGITKIEAGECPGELLGLIERVGREGIKTDSEHILSIIRRKVPDVKVELITRGPELQRVRSKVREFLVSVFGDYRSYVEFINEVTMRLAKEKLREVGGEPDKMIIQAITLIEELTETINAFVAHLREWYGIIFPDLGKIVDDHRLYVRIIREIGAPEKFSREALEKIFRSEKKIERIMAALKSSVIVKITSEDERRIREVADLILRMYEMRDGLEQYLKNLMEDTCPNITALVGPTIGAKLIRKAGGLRQLALKPASTIQVLGAEKALFRALRGRGTPPKHGIIFVHPLIFRAPWWQRGKIARALATKLAIAARVDYFSREYVGDELKNELMMRVEEIKKKYPKPPPEKVKRKKIRKKKRK